MAKRFLDTGFLRQKWIRKLTPEQKCFLIYLMLECDNGGIIEMDMDDIEHWIGKKIHNLDFLPNGYLIPVDENKYFQPKFIEWQYSDLSSNKNLVKQARQILDKYGLINKDFTLNLPKSYIKLTKGLPESQVTGNSNSKGNSNSNSKEVFEIARKQYPGTRRGLETEFTEYKKKHPDWKECLNLLAPAIKNQIHFRNKLNTEGRFIPEWKHFKTWLNQRCWEDEINEQNYKKVYIVPKKPGKQPEHQFLGTDIK